MAQINTANSALVTGRLIADPKIFKPNKDNSQGVSVTVWYRTGFGDKSVLRNVDLKGFIPATKDGQVHQGSVFAHMKKGDLVQIAYEPQVESFTRGGQKVHENVNKIVIGGITLLERKPKADDADSNADADAEQPAQAPETIGAV